MKHVLTALIVMAALGLAACETMKGAGEDISKAGKGISNASESVQKKF